MLNIARKAIRQMGYRRLMDRPVSIWQKVYLGMKYDCYISLRADIFYPERIVLARGSEVHPHAMLNFKSSQSSHSPSIYIGCSSKIMPHAKIIPQQGFVKIGDNCTIQYGCLLYGVGGLEIGDHCRIAAYTVISPMNHIYKDPNTPIWKQGETALGIRIGRDVWIGSGVTILDGVVIGDGSVIGAGSVVTRSIPSYSVAVGVPARVVKRRGGEVSVP